MSNQNLIKSKNIFPDENGKLQFDIDAYFIDRCPKYFGIILNFLRTGLLEKGANIDLNFLRTEAGYFGIQELVMVVNEEIEKQIGRNSRNDREQNSSSKNCLNCQNYCDFAAQDLAGQDFTGPYISSPNLAHQDIAQTYLQLPLRQCTEVCFDSFLSGGFTTREHSQTTFTRGGG